MAAEGKPGATRVTILYCDENPNTAAQWVNGLANSYAEGYRQQWRARAEKVYQDARAATALAEDKLRQATARLDAFVNEQLAQSRQNPPPSDSSHSSPIPGVRPSSVENPDWVELNRQLGELRQRRTKLLVDRTPIHPEVQKTDLRIEEVQRRLAETERWISARQTPGVSPSLAASNQRTATAMQTPTPTWDRAAAQAQLERLKAAVAAARQSGQQAADVEREAWQARQREPEITLQLAVAQPTSSSRPSARSSSPLPLPLRLRLALASMIAGLTTTIGLGMVATGAAMEPAVRSAAQLRALLAVPVVGVVPDTNPTKAARSKRSNLLRTLWIAVGLIVVASCVAAVLLSGR